MAHRFRHRRHGRPATGQGLERLADGGPAGEGATAQQRGARKRGIGAAEIQALVDGAANLEELRRTLILERSGLTAPVAEMPALPAAAGRADESPPSPPVPSTPSEVFGMSLRLFGTVFSTGSATEVLAMAASMPAVGPRLVVTANIDHVVVLSENAAFRKAYEGAAVRTLDGLPLVWLARALGARKAIRMTGHDLLAAAFEARPEPETRVFLVASSDRVAETIRRRFAANGLPPEAIAAAVPPFGFEEDMAYGRHLAERVRAHGTTLLVMGVGAPKSEIWVDRMGEALGSPVVLSVGEALNVAAGLVPRAPVLMQRMGLEWFFRFLHAPRRLFKRYFVRSWRFAAIASREFGHVVWRPAAAAPVRTASADKRPAP